MTDWKLVLYDYVVPWLIVILISLCMIFLFIGGMDGIKGIIWCRDQGYDGYSQYGIDDDTPSCFTQIASECYENQAGIKKCTEGNVNYYAIP